MKVHAPNDINNVAPVPWKNGGGTTRQLAVAPAHPAAAGDFLWRISIAKIDASGDFSTFSGIDRTILLWHGAGVTLHSPAWPDQRLDNPRAPFIFRGEDDVVCDLIDGPTQDLNLMVRRGAVNATLQVIETTDFALPACDDSFLLCASGSGRLIEAKTGRSHPVQANQFLRASYLQADEAVVTTTSDTVLVAITIGACTGSLPLKAHDNVV